MGIRSLTFFVRGNARPTWMKPRNNHGRRDCDVPRARASSSSAGGLSGGRQGVSLNPLAKSALTCAATSFMGDLLAQALTNAKGKYAKAMAKDFEWARALRMTGFGLCFYGPYQHWWYRFLEQKYPGRSVPAFLIKLGANQLLLGPVVLTAVFTWSLAFQGQLEKLPGKLKRDLFPSISNGWKFWIPAASINFLLIPLPYQVLYMSTCGVFWTAYLSYSAST
eukprot:jgi/Botrbrau1/5826/Bobra.0366s0011.1